MQKDLISLLEYTANNDNKFVVVTSKLFRWLFTVLNYYKKKKNERVNMTKKRSCVVWFFVNWCFCHWIFIDFRWSFNDWLLFINRARILITQSQQDNHKRKDT